ncbi:uncharacterized protein PAC_12017 [Phialocephala subalpina]|uniref:Heterokaryon incompatibility domain-containing protein n=1 Tax=Phialocephala subalpina TaxID=576137 RepID=A0A1L7XAQ6_9HELO|nr:uncharacterized protein PAC_12017 [Phialocephala subalpina]
MLQDLAVSPRCYKSPQLAPIDAPLSLAELNLLLHDHGQVVGQEVPSADKHINPVHYPLFLQYKLDQEHKTEASIQFNSQIVLDTDRNGQPGFNPYFFGLNLHVHEGWLPTRLLRLEDSSATRVRLVSTDDGSVQGPYMTLSHCWGKPDFFKHTAETSAKLFAGIETNLLPQTFRDAIHTTLQLNIRYLWIDSLCIVQDDQEDWVRESSMMGRVYQNGYCNIAATKSTAADKGFLVPETPRIQLPKPACYFQSAWNDKANFHWVLHDSKNLDHLLAGPLLGRGWVVQERLMAPRVLHFASKQLYWECHQQDACEIYPQGVPNRLSVILPSPAPGIKHRHSSLPTCSDFSEAMILWADIISLYSECQLTIEKDKLVAISGAAKTLHRILGGSEYLAGLWRDDLESQLLWSTKVEVRTRPQVYRAPSWSWASIDGAVFIPDRRWNIASCTCLVEILAAVTKPLGADLTGQVESGFLQLVTPLVSLSFRTHPSMSILEGCDAKMNGNWRKQVLVKPDIDEDPAAYLHCLPIWSCTNNTGTTFDCLIVRPIASGNSGRKGTFERWGVMSRVYFEDYGVPVVDKLPQWSKVQNEEWFEFEKDHGDGRYTITII